jgi:hypothetical protein
MAKLAAEELAAACKYWIKTMQREGCPAELKALQNNTPLPNSSKIKCFNQFLVNGFIYTGSHLQHSQLSTEQQHPLLLDGDHHFIKLLICDTSVPII